MQVLCQVFITTGHKFLKQTLFVKIKTDVLDLNRYGFFEFIRLSRPPQNEGADVVSSTETERHVTEIVELVTTTHPAKTIAQMDGHTVERARLGTRFQRIVFVSLPATETYLQTGLFS